MNPDPITITPSQRDLLHRFEQLVRETNERINLVSRRSMEDFSERHVAHSLALAARRFPDGSTVADFGTGGGLPGIPLAIVFPEVQFVLIDSIRKKAAAVQSIIQELELPNASVWHGRAEDWPGRADYVVSRATAPLADLWRWSVGKRNEAERPLPDDFWQPGLLALKGGDLRTEIADLEKAFRNLNINLHPLGARFEDKVIVEVR